MRRLLAPWPLGALAVVLLVIATAALVVRRDGSSGSDATTATTTTTSTTTTAATTTSTPTTTVVATTTAPPPTEPPPPPPTAAPAPAPAAPPPGPQCIVSLHGKGGSGSGSSEAGGVVRIGPSGNADGWGGRQWLYFPDASYRQARGVVAGAIDEHGCGEVIVNGFSNGGAFAVKLYCSGETFGGRLRGVIADDPVPDHAADNCRRAPNVKLTLYWTGALTSTAQPGWNCADQDWTCEGGSTVGIDAYAGHLGVQAKQSPNQSHAPYTNAPELNAW